jgi:hypothetical protein
MKNSKTKTNTESKVIIKVDNGVCPHCGYCPHCGRGGYWTYPYYPQPIYPNPYPTYPIYPSPIWYYQPSTTCITSSGSLQGNSASTYNTPYSAGITYTNVS